MAKTNGGTDIARFDVEAVTASQRKTLSALSQANQLAFEAAQALMRRQVEIGRQAMDDFSALLRDFVQPNGSPADRMARQADYSMAAIEKSLSNALELSELVAKANGEAFGILNKRVTESLDEVRDFATKRAVPAAS
jgi:phasin family protein